MEDQGQQDPKSPSNGSERSEPVRSRWTPKPEQILILESIFNSGMVNPPKDETVRIRKLLEKFGAVGDANVFYWFQNRRSRSRRRQRQMQASLEQKNQLQAQVGGANPYHHHQQTSSSSAAAAAAMEFGASSSFTGFLPSYLPGSSSSCGAVGGQEGLGGFFSSASAQMGFPQIDHSSSAAPAPSVLYPSDATNLNYNSGNY